MQNSLKWATLLAALIVTTAAFADPPLSSPPLTSPGVGLDCGDATSPSDRALCADPAAKADDDAMSSAYQALRAHLPPQDGKALLRAQQLWLRERENLCADAKDAQLAQCLAAQARQRRSFLQARPEAGPGSGGTLKPVFIEQEGRKGFYEIDVSVSKYAPPTNPAETLFNAEIDKLLKEVPAPPAQNDQYGRDMIYSSILHVRMTYASPRLISAHSESYVFAGGAHGSSATTDINIDAGTGRLLGFADVFPPDSGEKLTADCLRQVLKEKKIRVPDVKITGTEYWQLRKSIADGIAELDQWSFAPDGASVTYDAYALGAYVEGAYVCRFPKVFLTNLVKPGFALP